MSSSTIGANFMSSPRSQPESCRFEARRLARRPPHVPGFEISLATSNSDTEGVRNRVGTGILPVIPCGISWGIARFSRARCPCHVRRLPFRNCLSTAQSNPLYGPNAHATIPCFDPRNIPAELARHFRPSARHVHAPAISLDRNHLAENLSRLDRSIAGAGCVATQNENASIALPFLDRHDAVGNDAAMIPRENNVSHSELGRRHRGDDDFFSLSDSWIHAPAVRAETHLVADAQEIKHHIGEYVGFRVVAMEKWRWMSGRSH